LVNILKDGSACYVHFPKSEKEIKFIRVSKSNLNTKKEFDLRDNQLKTRIQNIKSLIDEIFQISQQTPKEHCLVHEFFHGRFDTSRITVIGHSFGGITAAVSSAIDSRIKSAIALGKNDKRIFSKMSKNKMVGLQCLILNN